MNTAVTYIAPPAENVVASNGGLVNVVVTYMVLDDLVVKPMSTISSIALLNEFSIKDVGVLKEEVVTLGMDEYTENGLFLVLPGFEDAEDFAAVQECLDHCLHGQHQ
ncbi:hypothetical protein RND71_006461 [Anisodus tanguticus]|uniref:Uncharacterized protein n=1 Tax=Anisodus tanguticus TaxID=243964 RepID=A0AAE1STU6_9SOLA|nr:hypothetical protein RND71_006461 [Anisodus tanguticus]